MDVGDLVICVDDTFLFGVSRPPRRSCIYTIEEWAYDSAAGGQGINLVELGPREGDRFISYSPSRFRPVDDEDISVFRVIVDEVFSDETVTV